jgi:hypothetical protein
MIANLSWRGEQNNAQSHLKSHEKVERERERERMFFLIHIFSNLLFRDRKQQLGNLKFKTEFCSLLAIVCLKQCLGALIYNNYFQ